MPTFQPYWGKPAVRNDRGDRGDVGIMRSPVRASILPNCGGRSVMGVPTATERSETHHGAQKLDGFLCVQPILVWGSGSQEAGIAAISFSNGAYQFLGSAEGVSSSRPRFCRAPRAAVVKAGRHWGGAADCVVSSPRLDGADPGPTLHWSAHRSRSPTTRPPA